MYPPIVVKIGQRSQGFAVLASTVLLGAAAIIFTVNMASTQLVDNQIMGNHYRNAEAFVNAESGINFVLGQLSDPALAQEILVNLPFEYANVDHHYRVIISEIHARKVAIHSYATSMDDTAKQEISLEIDFYLNYPVPNAALSSNGKLHLDASAFINDGCEGLDKEDCFASGNVANKMLISNPYIEEDDVEFCTGGSLGENIISDAVFQGGSDSKVIEVSTDEGGDISFIWESQPIVDGSEVAGIASHTDIAPHSLFEATFGFEMSQANLDELWDNAVKIDMTNGGYCYDMLQAVTDQEQIVFIKGDCDISQYDAPQSKTSNNKLFTIGSFEHPKLVFIEGGTFVTAPNTQAAIVGMLYLIPSKHDFVDEYNNLIGLDGKFLAAGQDAIQVEKLSIDMGGINVNGALLSEYRCSYARSEQVDGSEQSVTNKHFSARFDKLVLEELYLGIGMRATASGYRLSAGTWKDF